VPGVRFLDAGVGRPDDRVPGLRGGGAHRPATHSEPHTKGGIVKGTDAELAEPARHGTHAGYQRHYRRGEKACNACLIAHRIYSRATGRRFRARQRAS
jgi:hypothetical protein